MFILLLFVSYIVGSISSAYLITKWKRKECIFNLGTGNAGARNVSRLLGKPYGIVTILLDVLKGIIPIIIAQRFGISGLSLIFIAIAVVCGHNWSIFLHFKGGNGLASSIGILLYVIPIEAFISLCIGLMITYFWKYLPPKLQEITTIDIGPLFGYFLCPLLALHFNESIYKVIFPFLLGIPIILKRIYFLTQSNYKTLKEKL